MAAIAGFKPLLGATSHPRATSTPETTLSLKRIGVSRNARRRFTSALVVCSSSSSSSNEVSVSTTEAGTSKPDASGNWVPVVPLSALPRGERRLVRQDGETVLLLWYKNDVFAIENQSPAEGAYSEGLINARLTPEGCIICPSTESTYDLKTGKMVDWMPTNPILRVLTPSLRDLVTYPVKVEDDSIFISVQGRGDLAEIVFGGPATGQAGKTASNIDVDEVRMQVDDASEGFGWTQKNEIINGRAAMAGFFMLIIQELVTGKGFLKGLGFLDFLYKVTGYSP